MGCQIFEIIFITLRHLILETFAAIKLGPKLNKIDGSPNERRGIKPKSKPKHPTLKPHIHKSGDSKK